MVTDPSPRDPDEKETVAVPHAGTIESFRRDRHGLKVLRYFADLAAAKGDWDEYHYADVNAMVRLMDLKPMHITQAITRLLESKDLAQSPQSPTFYRARASAFGVQTVAVKKKTPAPDARAIGYRAPVESPALESKPTAKHGLEVRKRRMVRVRQETTISRKQLIDLLNGAGLNVPGDAQAVVHMPGMPADECDLDLESTPIFLSWDETVEE